MWVIGWEMWGRLGVRCGGGWVVGVGRMGVKCMGPPGRLMLYLYVTYSMPRMMQCHSL